MNINDASISDDMLVIGSRIVWNYTVFKKMNE
jgi:hypothetical protein